MAFIRGWIVEELEGGQILVQCDDGSVRPPIFSSLALLIIFIATGGS